mmetsp:Transcript_45077/g.133198  ORF Transcript_45077/g.133198 Transcript_45077/m.133198 type:complete len:213 (+) Transcript_45077:353-991(+)
MPPCAQVRLPACGRDVRAEQSPQHHDKGGMTDPNAVCRAPARTAARLVARLFCTRPDPVARARSLPFNACVSRRKGRRRPVFNLTSVPKRPESSSTASRPGGSATLSSSSSAWSAFTLSSCSRSSRSSPSSPHSSPLPDPLQLLCVFCAGALSVVRGGGGFGGGCLLCVRFERCPWLLGGFALGVSASVWCPALACRVRLRELACACPDSPC